MYNDEKLVTLIQAATQEVFSMMFCEDAKLGEVRRESGASESFDGVVSLVGVAGDWTGVGSVYCSAESAMSLASKMLMVEHQSVNEEVLDAMAEVANMIIGNVKNMLEEDLGPLALSIPTVIYGRNYRALNGGVKQRLVVPFQAGNDHVEIKLFLMEKSKEGVRSHGLKQVTA